MYYEVQGTIRNLWTESEEFIEELVCENPFRREPRLPVLVQAIHGMALTDCVGRMIRRAMRQAGPDKDPDNFWVVEALVRPLTAVEYAKLTTFDMGDTVLDPALVFLPVG